MNKTRILNKYFIRFKLSYKLKYQCLLFILFDIVLHQSLMNPNLPGNCAMHVFYFCFSSCTMVLIQGCHSSWNSWKVLELQEKIPGLGKALNLGYGPWKSWNEQKKIFLCLQIKIKKVVKNFGCDCKIKTCNFARPAGFYLKADLKPSVIGCCSFSEFSQFNKAK